jgi:hypothetical protein
VSGFDGILDFVLGLLHAIGTYYNTVVCSKTGVQTT